MSHHSPLQTTATQAPALRCHIYDNQSIIHLLGLPLPCVDPTAMLPAHIWLHGAPLSPGWDLPLVMGHLGGQMKLRLDEGFVYYEYGALWRHWQLHIDSLLSRRPTSAVVLFLLLRTHTQKQIPQSFAFFKRFLFGFVRFKSTSLKIKRQQHFVCFPVDNKNLFIRK